MTPTLLLSILRSGIRSRINQTNGRLTVTAMTTRQKWVHTVTFQLSLWTVKNIYRFKWVIWSSWTLKFLSGHNKFEETSLPSVELLYVSATSSGTISISGGAGNWKFRCYVNSRWCGNGIHSWMWFDVPRVPTPTPQRSVSYTHLTLPTILRV